MRDLETIDSELRLIAAVRRVCREYDGRVPSMTLVDELLDERRELSTANEISPTRRIVPKSRRASACQSKLGNYEQHHDAGTLPPLRMRRRDRRHGQRPRHGALRRVREVLLQRAAH